MRTLRARLLTASVAVVLLALVAALALLRQRAHHEIGMLADSRMRERHVQIHQRLQSYWDTHGSWVGAEPMLRDIEALTATRVAIVAGGRLVATSSPVSAGASALSAAAPSGRVHGPPDLEVRDPSGSVVGGLAFLEPSDELASSAAATLRLDRWLLAILVSVASAALLLLLLLSRTIAGPLERLTATVRAIEAGDQGRRTRIDSRDEIGVLAASFDTLMDRLAGQEQLRRDLTSDVAHELRTPLHSMRGELEAALEGLRPIDRGLAASLLEENQHLSRLVADLDQLAQGEAGQLRMEHRPLSVGALLARVVDTCAPLAREKGVALAITDVADVEVDGDADRLLQALRNLIVNAIAHSPSGETVTVRAEKQSGRIEIQVVDHGAGLRPGEGERVFERFYRGDPSRSRATGGAGLGLAIVRQIAELHGGTAGVSSTPGAGSTFSLWLPVVGSA